MKNNRNQRQIKQESQYPRQLAKGLPRIFILQCDTQGYIAQKDNPHSMIQTLQLVSFRNRNCKSMFIHQTDNQQDGCQVGQGRHHPQRHTYIRMNPLILIQKKLMINLHKYTD